MLFLLLSVGLLLLSFPNAWLTFGFWPAAWVFGVPFFFALEGKSFRQRFFLGAVFSLLFYFALLYWFIPYSFIGYLVFVLFLSIQPIVFFSAFPSFAKPGWGRVFYIAALWVVSEWIRKFFMHGFSWDLAHSQSFNLSVLHWVKYAGSPLLSFLLIAHNVLIFDFIKTKALKKKILAGLAVFYLIVWGVGFKTLNSPSVNTANTLQVAIVQPNFSPQEKLEDENINRMVDEMVQMTLTLKDRRELDLIVWPETVIPTDFREDPVLLGKLKSLAQNLPAPLLLGATLWEGEKYFNSAVLFKSDGSISQRYDKRFLVPFSEYVPFSDKVEVFIKRVFAFESFDFSAGGQPNLFSLPLRDGQLIRFGVATCSEDTIGEVFDSYRALRAQFVVVLLNDSWFGKPVAYVQHAQNAVIHAAENYLPVLRASNSGWSMVVDADGKVDSSGDPGFNQKMVRVYNLKTASETQTLGGGKILRFGFWLFCVAFVIMGRFSTGNKKNI
jgi:apolipoprotein N-acyltransferase